MLPAVEGPDETRYLTDEPIDLTTGVVRFTAEEEAILDEPAPYDEILIKPNDNPARRQIFLSHTTYTKWFNRAFGRGQWHLKQLSKPQKAGNMILIPYALIIRNVALYSAYGAAEYIENNRQQTYDDVIEGTHGYALRRFAKRLGVGLELWNKEFGERFLADYDARTQPQRRQQRQAPRQEDPEYRPSRQEPERATPEPRKPAPAQKQKPVASHPHTGEKITTDQLTRFWTIARKMRTDEEVKTFLSTEYGLASSRDILRRDYDDIVAAVEHPGPLVKAQSAREPGEDG